MIFVNKMSIGLNGIFTREQTSHIEVFSTIHNRCVKINVKTMIYIFTLKKYFPHKFLEFKIKNIQSCTGI